MSGEQFDDPNRESVGLPPIWEGSDPEVEPDPEPTSAPKKPAKDPEPETEPEPEPGSDED